MKTKDIRRYTLETKEEVIEALKNEIVYVDNTNFFLEPTCNFAQNHECLIYDEIEPFADVIRMNLDDNFDEYIFFYERQLIC